MRRIELKRAKRYFDSKSNKMFVKGTMYTVGDDLAHRLLDQTDQRDDPYFRDHGEISKAQVRKMLQDQEKKKREEAEKARARELENMDSVVVHGEVEEVPDPVAADTETTEVG